MASTKKKPTKLNLGNRTRIILPKLTIVLIVLVTVLSVYIYYIKQSTSNDTTTASSISWGPYVSLSSLQFKIVNGKATVRTDTAFNDIKVFLNKESADSRCGVSGSAGPGYVYIQAWSSDEKQLLLRYGCISPSAQMYATKTDQGWHIISPTNHFDAFEIPDCDYLTENNISPEIAPVCANKLGDSGAPIGNPKYLNR